MSSCGVLAHNNKKLGSAEGRWTARVRVSERCLPSIVAGDKVGAGGEEGGVVCGVREASRKVRIDWRRVGRQSARVG